MNSLQPEPSASTCVALRGSPLLSGRLDDPSWARCPSYALSGMPDANGDRLRLEESGRVRFLWDEDALYVGAELHDSDVVSEANADGLHAYLLGDVCEVFLKPRGGRGYGEFHVTPNGHQTTFLWPSGGRRLPSALQQHSELQVSTHVRGRLNDATVADDGWSAEMRIPWSLLLKTDTALSPDDSWAILVGRYNYGLTLSATELSSMPPISAVDFHSTAEYATLRLDALS